MIPYFLTGSATALADFTVITPGATSASVAAQVTALRNTLSLNPLCKDVVVTSDDIVVCVTKITAGVAAYVKAKVNQVFPEDHRESTRAVASGAYGLCAVATVQGFQTDTLSIAITLYLTFTPFPPPSFTLL